MPVQSRTKVLGHLDLVRTATLALAAAAVGQVVLGTYWWIGNQATIPKYGDTVEYIAQSESFALDGYRTVAYPLAIRSAVELGAVLNIPWTTLLYHMQLVAWSAAAWYLVRSVAPHARRLHVAVGTCAVVTIPLPLHYAATVLTDSLALSTLAVVVGAIARVAGRNRTDWRTLTVLVLGVFAAVFVRPDRLYITSAIAVGAALVILLRTRARSRARVTRRRALVLSVVLLLGVLVPALTTTAWNRTMQTADLGRAQPSITSSLFGRVAGPHIDEIRDLVPPDVAAAFPSPDADRWEVAAALGEAGGDTYLLAAVRTTLDCCAVDVVAQSARDVAHGIGGPYQTAYDWVTLSNSSANWDFSRMAQHRPDATGAFMAWSVASALVLALASVAAIVEARRRRHDEQLAGVTAVLVGSAVVVATFFGLITSSVPNPRYTLIAEAVAWVLPLGTLISARRGSPPDELAPRDDDTATPHSAPPAAGSSPRAAGQRLTVRQRDRPGP